MKKLKFKLKKNTYKLKKIYSLDIFNTKKTTKFNNLLNLGNYISKIKLYTFIYPKIICSLKLGSNFSKQASLISLFYLKNFLNKNL